MMKILETKIPPLLIVLILSMIMWGISLIDPKAIMLSLSLRGILSSILVLIGVGLTFAGAVSFRLAKTTVNPVRPDTSSALVTSGIYRITRNPMYLGFGLLLCAWAILLSSFISLLILPVYIAYIQTFQIRPEEKALEKKFGEMFLNYKRKVRRWI